MNERMDERYGLDTPQERERKATDLRKKYEALERENADLKQQVADGDLAFNHANEVVAKLEAQVARLSWQPLTPENLPKVGDEVMRTRVGLSGESYTTTESVMFSDTTFDEYMAVHCTHFRPINPSLIASRTTPAKP